MSEFKFWGWDKKPRTMLRYIKPGDIFCFRLDDKRYCFGRIISKIFIGHVAEFFSFTSSIPEVNAECIGSSKRIIAPIVIDSYSLFDKKIEDGSDWRIIGHQNDYMPTNVDNIYFAYGVESSCKKIDVWGNETPISEGESEKLPQLSPKGDFNIKQLLKNI